MQYIERIAFIALLHCLVAYSKPLPLTKGHVPQAMTTSQPNAAATTELSQLHSFNSSADNNATGDKDKLNAARSKTSKVDKSHLDNLDYFEGDLKVSQEIIDTYYGVHNSAQVIHHNCALLCIHVTCLLKPVQCMTHLPE